VHEAELRTDLEALLAACRQAGATATRSAWAAPERERLWQARHALSAAMVKIRPTKISEDVTVPRTRLADLLQAIAAIRERHGIPLVVFGHAGDGNLHPNILIDRRDPDQAARAEAAVAELFEAAIRLGGTLSGEHGIGLLKAPFLPRQFGPTELEVFQALKRALDPKGILSPGKMLAAVDAGRWRAW
jgi:glycolate oxidase